MNTGLHGTLSRRQLIGGAAAAGLASSAPALAKAPFLKTQAPAFYRFNIGTIEATVVSDGPLSIGDPVRTFKGPTAEEVGKMMTDNFLPKNEMVLDQNVIVINLGDKLALFETGMSSIARDSKMGLLVENLKKAGIDPADIDAVIPTHTHVDHIGGIVTKDGKLNFPNAQIYLTQIDFDFWTDDRRMGTPAEGSARAAQKNLLPHRDRIVFYKHGQDVLSGVQSMATPGHTMGHSSFVINSGDRSLFLTGDTVHHNILLENPRMEVGFDTDSKMGVDTRIKMLDMLVARKMDTLIYHMAWPGIGNIVKNGAGYRFIAKPQQMVL